MGEWTHDPETRTITVLHPGAVKPGDVILNVQLPPRDCLKLAQLWPWPAEVTEVEHVGRSRVRLVLRPTSSPADATDTATSWWDADSTSFTISRVLPVPSRAPLRFLQRAGIVPMAETVSTIDMADAARSLAVKYASLARHPATTSTQDRLDYARTARFLHAFHGLLRAMPEADWPDVPEHPLVEASRLTHVLAEGHDVESCQVCRVAKGIR